MLIAKTPAPLAILCKWFSHVFRLPVLVQTWIASEAKGIKIEQKRLAKGYGRMMISSNENV
jgi:hypothetical protein